MRLFAFLPHPHASSFPLLLLPFIHSASPPPIPCPKAGGSLCIKMWARFPRRNNRAGRHPASDAHAHTYAPEELSWAPTQTAGSHHHHHCHHRHAHALARRHAMTFLQPASLPAERCESRAEIYSLPLHPNQADVHAARAHTHTHTYACRNITSCKGSPTKFARRQGAAG